MSTNLNIEISQESGKIPVTVMKLIGSLDASTQGELEKKVIDAISGSARNIIFDLSGVTYLGSAGLRAFNAVSKKLKESSPAGKMKLLNPSSSAGKVMKALGFDSFFEVHSDIKGAMSSF